jgi:hypothetical protein
LESRSERRKEGSKERRKDGRKSENEERQRSGCYLKPARGDRSKRSMETSQRISHALPPEVGNLYSKKFSLSSRRWY